MIERDPEQQDSDAISKIEIKELKLALEEEKEKARTNLANWQRSQADFSNYKRRIEQEKEETAKYAGSHIIKALLPFLDDLQIALSSAPAESADSWVNGFKLIEKKFLLSLENQGVSIIKAEGEPFDPRFHEAIRQESGEEGIIIREVQRGYMFYDRILRPSRVVVGNGEEQQRE